MSCECFSEPAKETWRCRYRIDPRGKPLLVLTLWPGAWLLPAAHCVMDFEEHYFLLNIYALHSSHLTSDCSNGFYFLEIVHSEAGLYLMTLDLPCLKK